MANGKRHDHPLTDILHFDLPVYGEQTDDMIRKIAGLCSRRELNEWWEREIGWTGNKELALNKAQLQLDSLLQRAKQSGWEMPD
jgi:hypothetical protein